MGIEKLSSEEISSSSIDVKQFFLFFFFVWREVLQLLMFRTCKVNVFSIEAFESDYLT